MSLRKFIKKSFYIVCYVMVLPFGLMARLSNTIFNSVLPFHFFAEIFSLTPSPFGIIARACYYNQTLKKSHTDLVVLFGTLLTKMDSTIGRNVRIGGYTTVGLVQVEDNAIIANRVSILSGRHQHNFDDLDKDVLDSNVFTPVLIGRNAFIGESSVVTSNVGCYSLIGAGSVVIRDIPDHVVAVGNPAKVVKERPHSKREPLDKLKA